MQRTALCARKIVAFLKAGISSATIPIYECAAADAQPVGRIPNAVRCDAQLSNPARSPSNTVRLSEVNQCRAGCHLTGSL